MTTTPPAPAPAPAAVPTPAPRPIRRPAAFVLAAVALGVGLRLFAFAADRPLWIDEAMIALNLCDRPVGHLFEPLAHDQAAPVGFLLAGNLSVALFGPTPFALRLPAVVGALAGLGLFAVAALRLLPRPAARLAVLLFALSPTLVSYAAEVKQYGTDATMSAGLLALFAPLLVRPTRGRLIAAAVGGAAAVWLSHPAVFVLAAAGAVLFAQTLRRKEHPLPVIGVGVAWAVSFAAVWAVNVRFAGGNAHLAEYWAGQFLPLSAGAVPWLAEHVAEVFGSAGGYGGAVFQAGGLAAAVAAAGAVFLWRGGRRAEVGVLVGGFLAAVLASAGHKYPIFGRLMLFAVPAAVLLLAYGAVRLAAVVGAKSRWAAVALLAAVVLAPAATLYEQFRRPPRTEDLPAAMKYVRERWQPGDRVYVYNGAADAGAGPAFAYYTRALPFPPDAVVLGGEHRSDPRGYRAEAKEMAKASGRVWVLFSHPHADEEAWLRAAFDEQGERAGEFRGTGAAAFGYAVR